MTPEQWGLHRRCAGAGPYNAPCAPCGGGVRALLAGPSNTATTSGEGGGGIDARCGPAAAAAPVAVPDAGHGPSLSWLSHRYVTPLPP